MCVYVYVCVYVCVCICLCVGSCSRVPSLTTLKRLENSEAPIGNSETPIGNSETPGEVWNALGALLSFT